LEIQELRAPFVEKLLNCNLICVSENLLEARARTGLDQRGFLAQLLSLPQIWIAILRWRPKWCAESNADASTTIYFGPKQPEGVKRGNWIQTMPGKGWFTILRLYGPLEPFFDKSWRPSEIEEVK